MENEQNKRMHIQNPHIRYINITIDNAKESIHKFMDKSNNKREENRTEGKNNKVQIELLTSCNSFICSPFLLILNAFKFLFRI